MLEHSSRHVLTTLHRIRRYYASGGGGDVDVRHVGAFAVVLHRSSDAWYLSYATPVDDVVGDAAGALHGVLDVFADAGRAPTFEWIDDLAPTLGAAIVQLGLPEPQSEPLLTVTRAALRIPRIAGASATIVDAHHDIRVLREVAHAVFPELGPLTEDEVARVAAEIARGQRVQAAVFGDGHPVALGDHSPSGGVTEITGVGTLPDYRRRGLAGLVTATLAEQAFGAGCDVVYLTAASDEAARVYERVGFTRIATARTTSLRGKEPVDGEDPRH